MKISILKETLLACGGVLAIASALTSNAATSTTFDDFNVNEGHFNQHPGFSGSTAGVTNSTADRVTTGGPVEGTGYERLVLYTNGAPTCRVRFLSGTGTPANNTPFTTSVNPDGWIGCYVRTTNEGWNVQMFIEGSGGNNGGVPKDILPDGQWHLYEWNLDDNSGGGDGWGTISGVISGTQTIGDGSHTIDSVIFRNTTLPYGTNVIDMDFVAKNDLGSVSNLLSEPCLATPGVLVNGPISTNSPNVLVTAVATNATLIKVYQDSGAGSVVIGTKNSGITGGNNTVTATGLVKGAKIVATQTVNGQESCLPASGLVVGGGANPPIRVTLSLRENPTATGPVGADGSAGWNDNMHFLPGKTVLTGYCPGQGALLIYPSNEWQTISVNRGTVSVGDSGNVAGAPAAAGGYFANDQVSLQVYALKNVPVIGTNVYSVNVAESAVVTSNDVFTVNWTWNAVPGATGYRILRNLNFAGYYEFVDVASNSYSDANTGWTYDAAVVVEPKTTQETPSIAWYPSTGNANNIVGDWAALESIALACEGDSGPYDIFIDSLANGTHGVFQDFEVFNAGTLAGVVFQAPHYSSTTDGSLTPAPNSATISDLEADTGTKSIRVRWQWKSAQNNQWLRLTTYQASSMPSPLVDMSQPISFRMLVLPVGVTPGPTEPPVLSVQRIGDDIVLNWTGAHNLQAASQATGTYTNLGVTTGPYTNTFTEPQKFFRLED